MRTTLLKAWILLLLALAMQFALVLKGLHTHEQVCLLNSAENHQEQQILHAHADHDHECAWSAFQIASGTLSLPMVFAFYAAPEQQTWATLIPEQVQLLAFQPQGRAPPAA